MRYSLAEKLGERSYFQVFYRMPHFEDLFNRQAITDAIAAWVLQIALFTYNNTHLQLPSRFVSFKFLAPEF